MQFLLTNLYRKATAEAGKIGEERFLLDGRVAQERNFYLAAEKSWALAAALNSLDPALSP